MTDNEFRQMMRDPEVPMGRKLWHVKSLLEAGDMDYLVSTLDGFLESVESLLMATNPNARIEP